MPWIETYSVVPYLKANVIIYLVQIAKYLRDVCFGKPGREKTATNIGNQKPNGPFTDVQTREKVGFLVSRLHEVLQ